jgi:hypothetical protein
MIRTHHILAAGVLAFWLCIPTGLFAEADDAAAEPKAKPAESVNPAKAVKPADAASPAKEAAKPSAAKAKRELSPAMTTLRDLVRGTLVANQKQPFNTQDNSATEIMNYCMAFGCGTTVTLSGTEEKTINGITCLCWNYSCAGFEILGPSQGHIAARIGYGYQEHPGEFLAMLALARVPSEYPVRLGDATTRTVADVVEAEKLACRSEGDASLMLIGLSHYVDEPLWKNDRGETWSIERMIQRELAQSAATAPEGGLNRLLGLSYAVACRTKHGQPLDGQFERAQKYIADCQDFAMQLQNSDGSWGPYFLAARSTSADAGLQLRSTGRILEWLAMSLPDGRLQDAHVTNAVTYVSNLLGSQRYQANAPALPTREIAALGHALHALAVYDERVFKPADTLEKPAAKKQPATANRDVKSVK